MPTGRERVGVEYCTMPNGSRPNIIVVFADQLRGSSLGHVGQEPVLTPNLDRFASDGLRMTRAVSNCPLCCPMRASMITGLHALRHGVIGNDIRLREDAPGIAKSLGLVGYRTAYIGKWHLDGPDRTAFAPPGPRRQGFDHWAACNCNHSYYEAYCYRDEPEPIWFHGYEPAHQTAMACRYVREARASSSPFCLFLSYGPPHCPYDHVPRRFLDLYDPAALAMRANAVGADPRMVAGYYAHVSALDACFGRLLDALDDAGMADDTLVIFTSDHGDMLYSQGRGWKSKPWAESVIVPLIARRPGRIARGAVEHNPFGLVDLMPTLCAIADAPVPDGIEGRAWPEMLHGRPGPRPASQPIYLAVPAVPQSFPGWRGIVTERHTYARFADRPWVLYDDTSDPYQTRNLAYEPTSLRVRGTLDAELGEWLERLGDDFAPADVLARRYGVETDGHGVPVIVQQPAIVEEQRRRSLDRRARMKEDAVERALA
jgi:arylsulfatase A-like enzyme